MNNIKEWSNEDLINKWIKADKPIGKRYGFKWKGAWLQTITKEEAINKVPNYTHGTIGFHEMDFYNENGVETLVFTEYSANDLY